ncbi:uncharacterized protein LOC130646140 [Hydractinia symbiolongicarpus]|uniref:uncharacterized protein LOC130646140 n=1 Tax=Hydractinia symbiolongicarpus TaxID=13093 RepID=UPI00255198FB|nr:uncharacterized protein LOC130646140 [Hydractinia symbiolongicarpus]
MSGNSSQDGSIRSGYFKTRNPASSSYLIEKSGIIGLQENIPDPLPDKPDYLGNESAELKEMNEQVECSTRQKKINQMHDGKYILPFSPSNWEKSDIVLERKEKSEKIDAFIENLVEGEETNLKQQIKSFKASAAFLWEYENRHLLKIELKQFDGDPAKWPDFIQNLKSRVHEKTSFNDKIRMERLSSVLDEEAKKAINSVGTRRIFYATTLKTLKRNFGNAIVVSHLKLSTLLELPQINANDRMALRRFHQQLKSTNT